MRRSPILCENFGVWRLAFGVRARARARKVVSGQRPGAQKLLAIELADVTGTMTITVVPRPGVVWISNLPPISDAL